MGHLSFKKAALERVSRLPPTHKPRVAEKGWIALGIACFMLRFFCWLALLAFIPLSLAILIVSLDIVAVMLGGRVFFSEALSWPRLVAAALIGSGVALVGVR